jgi:hypothetical protein
MCHLRAASLLPSHAVRVARAMLLVLIMKPVLFIVFLALGPALAEQLRVVPPPYADAMAVPVALGTATANRGAVAHAIGPAGRAWLCGGGS